MNPSHSLPNRQDLLSLDYLIFSSHKTGTQTLVETLNRGGVRALQCHELTHLGLMPTDLRAYADAFAERNGRPLQILSVFREPLERYISSFFQEHGTRPLRLNEVRHEKETIIHQYPIERLHHTFREALRSRTIICYEDSLHDICRQLHLSPGSLAFDPRVAHTRNSLGTLDLILLRFDLLFRDPESVLSQIIGRPLRIESTNCADQKWYRDIYAAFRQTLTLPPQQLRQLYREKHDLLALFYPGLEETLLNRALQTYGEKPAGLAPTHPPKPTGLPSAPENPAP